jgi:hypothetical protein
VPALYTSFKNAFSGKYRVLLVFSPSEVHPDYRQTKRETKENSAGIEERDMAVFYLVDRDASIEEEQRRLRERYGIAEEQFAVILIGKDGGEKLRRLEHVPIETVFALIDTMPMRRREMQDREQ